MSNHQWCRDVPRDEAVRAAEDATAVPEIQHRDLPDAVAELRERVARLEAPASDEAIAYGATLDALAAARESLAAANRGITRLTSERDAARAEAKSRGWLTAEERACIEELIPYTFTGEQTKALTMLLARSTPPMVRRPNPNVVITTVDARERIDRQWIAAIRAAGVEVEG